MAICSAEAATLSWPMADFIRPGTSAANAAAVPKLEIATVEAGTSSGTRWLNP